MISAGWATERGERQKRRQLVQADFDQLARAGFTRTGVPESHGGVWRSIEESTGPVCDMLRVLAHGDSSVALVAAMHPSVLLVFGWLSVTEADGVYQAAWDEQREWAFGTAIEGHFWGTITSESGSGGDVSKTRSTAKLENGQYRMTGTKHFGSGSGMTSFMVTTAVPEGESGPESFFMDMRDVVMDGSGGVKLIAPWDGHGMTATQSHTIAFVDFPVTRRAWPNAGDQIRSVATASVQCMFTAVIVGIVEVAVRTAREQLSGKKDSLTPYEQVEWSQVEVEAWQIQQFYVGMLRAIEDPETRAFQSLLAKTAVAQVSESLLARLSKVIGGSAFSRHAPYGAWAQDVRALGFLRQPWGLAFDQIHDASWS
ncbi:MAG: hypothetical protein O3C10_05320 [Chloroflexi bacterium]|nr:hypothetical protein [Chloroflexota bacterium]